MSSTRRRRRRAVEEEEGEGGGGGVPPSSPPASQRRVRGSGVTPLPEDAYPHHEEEEEEEGGGGGGHEAEERTRGSREEEPATTSSSDEEDEDEDSEDEYVAYGPEDVEAATQRVLAMLRPHFSTSPDRPHHDHQDHHAPPPPSGGGGQRLEQLPTTRKEWGRSEGLGRACRVEREVNAVHVVGLLGRAGLIRLIPPASPQAHHERTKEGKEEEQEEEEEGGRETSSPSGHDDGETTDERESHADDEDEDGVEDERVRVLMASKQEAELESVGVEWVASEKDLASLEDALTRQYGDGSIILARVLPWLRPRLRHRIKADPKRAAGRGRARGGRREEAQRGGRGNKTDDKDDGGLPTTLRTLMQVIERERWGYIIHRIRPGDVLHALELDDIVDVGTDGRLRYNTAKIVADKAEGGNAWKWVLGLLLLVLMMLPSWLR